MTPTPERPDVLIVGSGIMGAGVARMLRDEHPDLVITMIDGAPAVGAVRGLHLHDSPDPAVWSRYNFRVSSGIQGMYVGADVSLDVADDVRDMEPGMYNIAALGEDAHGMPASALAWNVGGMGVHWTAATPWPAGDERFDFGDPEGFDADLARARRVLQVHDGPIGPTAAGEVVLGVLDDLYGSAAPADRHPQVMPMAVAPTPDGPNLRVGPSRIFPAIATDDDPAFDLLPGTLAVELLVGDGDGHVRGALARDVATGVTRELLAGITVVCADVMRTPQLLFASGIRPAALGRFLNEHAFVTSRVLMDVERFGLDLDSLPRVTEGEFCTDSLWLPQNGAAQPFHGQVMNTTYVDEDDTALAYSVGVSLYAPVESRASNRLAFSETELDVTGMPRITVEFEYSETDAARIDQARGWIRDIAERFGEFDAATESAVLAPGSSLHQTGTVRMGLSDDGSSVCNTDGRVWGFDNLYLAGNGVVPSAVVGNATLTGMITAVRAASAISASLLSTTSL